MRCVAYLQQGMPNRGNMQAAKETEEVGVNSATQLPSSLWLKQCLQCAALMHLILAVHQCMVLAAGCAVLTPNFCVRLEHMRVQDPFDKERITSINNIKKDGKKWIAEYARGGSASGQSAKRMYVAVDSVLGHVAANGAAPFPKPKVKFVKETLAQVDSLLAGETLNAASYQ